MKTELTPELVEETKPQEVPVILWDTQVKGLFLKVMPGGLKTFGMYYREDGREKRPKIGDVGQISLDEARQWSRNLLKDLEEKKRRQARKKLGL
ncbi:MAG TPA: Arm DNA-binding domain-containing protein [Dongiaceae bacterium]|nr:Arm DNA-binding domain-containing protein [Dongiaceae bacterium]